jgi:hypothetical protein
MHQSTFVSRQSLWLLAICVGACGGRAIDGPDSGPLETGGNGGAGATGGSATGGSGPAGGGTGGSGGTTGGSGNSPGGSGGSTTTGGAGNSPGGSGGSTTTGGAGAGIGGTGGSMGGSNDGGLGGCWCTRRPGPGVSFRCPAGIDQSSTSIIGPAGGGVGLVGQQGTASGVGSSLTIPPKAFDKEVAVTLTETSIPPPNEFFDWSPIYEVQPIGVTSSSLMKLRLPWGNRDGSFSGLTMYYAKDKSGPFVPVSDFYINAGFSDAGITEFGFFFMGVRKSPAETACP